LVAAHIERDSAMSTTTTVNTVVVEQARPGWPSAISYRNCRKTMSFSNERIGRATPGATTAGIRSPSIRRDGNRACPASNMVKTTPTAACRGKRLSPISKISRLPVRYRAHIRSIGLDDKTGQYDVEIEDGEQIRAQNVVVATGLYQRPKIPALSVDFSRLCQAASLRRLSQPAAASARRRARRRQRAIRRADRRGTL
jgi:hypothetical protein